MDEFVRIGIMFIELMQLLVLVIIYRVLRNPDHPVGQAIQHYIGSKPRVDFMDEQREMKQETMGLWDGR